MLRRSDFYGPPQSKLDKHQAIITIDIVSNRERDILPSDKMCSQKIRMHDCSHIAIPQDINYCVRAETLGEHKTPCNLFYQPRSRHHGPCHRPECQVARVQHHWTCCTCGFKKNTRADTSCQTQSSKKPCTHSICRLCTGGIHISKWDCFECTNNAGGNLSPDCPYSYLEYLWTCDLCEFRGNTLGFELDQCTQCFQFVHEHCILRREGGPVLSDTLEAF